jgi:NAD(P)-dependent dehydrogenase (short-subunit alcohol dehydrogenase family)
VRSLAFELGDSGITVNSVCPGAVAGPRVDALDKGLAATHGTTEEEALSQVAAISPMGRLVQPEEVADACVFLASPQAAAITGEDLNVTAGAVMY